MKRYPENRWLRALVVLWRWRFVAGTGRQGVWQFDWFWVTPLFIIQVAANADCPNTLSFMTGWKLSLFPKIGEWKSVYQCLGSHIVLDHMKMWGDEEINWLLTTKQQRAEAEKTA